MNPTPPTTNEVPAAPPFGRCAGLPLTSLRDYDLEWYAIRIDRSISDPTKERWREINVLRLSQIRDEQHRRACR